jgi:hypothetical protein
MSKTNQGPILTVSPAVGSYKVKVDIAIDSGHTGIAGYTGISAGDVYAATLVDYWRDTGVTGISGANFKNMTDPNVVGGVSYK